MRRLAQRTIFPQQWHLKTTTINGRWVNASANVEAAHTITKGDGVTIAIIDTGTDIDHDEFSSPGKMVAPRDTTANDADPRPIGRGENHGTACAGVACADGRFGASGVAPRANLMPIRMMSQLGSQGEANAFYWAAENGADVISCSWGPADGKWWKEGDRLQESVAPLPDSTRLAIDYAVNVGEMARAVSCYSRPATATSAWTMMGMPATKEYSPSPPPTTGVCVVSTATTERLYFAPSPATTSSFPRRTVRRR